MNHKAIYALYPNVRCIDDTAGAMDADGNPVTIDMDAVNAWVDPDAYKFSRALEYPNLSEFADAYYWAQKGDTTLMDSYIEKCDVVKNKYPKPTE